MARSSDELQKLMQSLVETFDAHLEVIRRDAAAQQEAMVHEVRSLHEATIRAMAELRAAVHRVELALHDQFAALEPTPAAGIARPHLGATTPPRQVAAVPEAPQIRPLTISPPPSPPTPSAPDTHGEVATPASPTVPTLPDRSTADHAARTVEAPHQPASQPAEQPADQPTPSPTAHAGLDVDRLVAMLESRLGEIDMNSGTSAD